MAEFIFMLLPSEDVSIQQKVAVTVGELCAKEENIDSIATDEGHEALLYLLESKNDGVLIEACRSIRLIIKGEEERRLMFEDAITPLCELARRTSEDKLLFEIGGSMINFSTSSVLKERLLQTDRLAALCSLLRVSDNDLRLKLLRLINLLSTHPSFTDVAQSLPKEPVMHLHTIAKAGDGERTLLAQELIDLISHEEADESADQLQASAKSKKDLKPIIDDLRSDSPGAIRKSLMALASMEYTADMMAYVLKRQSACKMAVSFTQSVGATYYDIKMQAWNAITKWCGAMQSPAICKRVCDEGLLPIAVAFLREDEGVDTKLLLCVLKCLKSIAEHVDYREPVCQEEELFSLILDCLVTSTVDKVQIVASELVVLLSTEDNNNAVMDDQNTMDTLLSVASSTRSSKLEVNCLQAVGHLAFERANAAKLLEPETLARIESLQQEATTSEVRDAVKRLIAVLGIIPEISEQRDQGVRILAIDGGGVRGLVAIQILQELEKVTGRRIHQMFDIICGTSTGGIVAFLVGIENMPLQELEHLYLTLCTHVFQARPVISTLRTVAGSKYKVEHLEHVLQKHTTQRDMIDYAIEPGARKVFAVASKVSTVPAVPYLFRNYHCPFESPSGFEGTGKWKQWEALRASSAAPSYFEPCIRDDAIYQDGGLVANNPSAIALHEMERVFPGCPLRCLVSIGTGAPPPSQTRASGWGGLANVVINSATSVDTIHRVLSDVLPNTAYFRIQPVGDPFSSDLDEVRPAEIAAMRQSTTEFVKQNQSLLKAVSSCLLNVAPMTVPASVQVDFSPNTRDGSVQTEGTTTTTTTTALPGGDSAAGEASLESEDTTHTPAPTTTTDTVRDENESSTNPFDDDNDDSETAGKDDGDTTQTTERVLAPSANNPFDTPSSDEEESRGDDTTNGGDGDHDGKGASLNPFDDVAVSKDILATAASGTHPAKHREDEPPPDTPTKTANTPARSTPSAPTFATRDRVMSAPLSASMPAVSTTEGDTAAGDQARAPVVTNSTRPAAAAPPPAAATGRFSRLRGMLSWRSSSPSAQATEAAAAQYAYQMENLELREELETLRAERDAVVEKFHAEKESYHTHVKSLQEQLELANEAAMYLRAVDDLPASAPSSSGQAQATSQEVAQRKAAVESDKPAPVVVDDKKEDSHEDDESDGAVVKSEAEPEADDDDLT